ncbi:MAG: VTT domain-containing protein [Ilumatobacteraceae bacterium]
MRSLLRPTARRGRIAGVVAVWAVVFGVWIWWRRGSELGVVEASQQLVDAASGSWWAVFAFLLASMVRPFLLLPASILTVAMGLVFGPVVGLAVAVIALNLSAIVGYGLGGAFTREARRDTRLAAWGRRLRDNSFEAVLVMRLVFLPYDVVNYFAGYLRIRWWPFIIATNIGSLPASASFVFLGASITSLEDGIGGIDPRLLALSVVLIVASLAVSRLVKRRQPVDPPTAVPVPGGER